MKTILYQPLFINPQAYFVFPQLYHIEKGDSYIEPANITGQLIINNLSEGLTLTPTVNVIQDSNQVDFSLFKGKHIRISQYTNIGAVVLGEWYIPGTPEPEQPDWFKESIVAWYSPYCKQRMTNFDVIEAYIQDFTVWRRYDRKIIVSNNKVIVKANTPFSGNWIISNRKKFEIGKIKVTGLDGDIGNNSLFYSHRNKDGKRIFILIEKDGIYEFPNNDYDAKAGFYCNSSLTFSNDIIIEQLPTSILKDFSGNGNHAYLYGGKGKLNSGMGVYKEDFTTWNYVPERGDVTRSYNTIHITKVTNTVTANIISKTNEFGNSITLKIVGATSDNPLMVGTYSKPNGYTAISKDGVYSFEIDEQYWGFRFNKDGDVNVTITQIPDYPDQLCYDGKMYAVAYNMPILTDYTVIAERTWFEKEEYSAFISNSLGGMEDPSNGAFSVELKSLNSFTTISFGSITSIGIPEKGITYQTKQSYNGNSINVGTKESNDILILGGRYFYKNDNAAGNTWNGCHGTIIVANRSFTEEEINWLKQNWDKL